MDETCEWTFDDKAKITSTTDNHTANVIYSTTGWDFDDTQDLDVDVGETTQPKVEADGRPYIGVLDTMDHVITDTQSNTDDRPWCNQGILWIVTITITITKNQMSMIVVMMTWKMSHVNETLMI